MGLWAGALFATDPEAPAEAWRSLCTAMHRGLARRVEALIEALEGATEAGGARRSVATPVHLVR